MSGAKASAPKSNLCSFELRKKMTFEVTERLELISLQSLYRFIQSLIICQSILL